MIMDLTSQPEFRVMSIRLNWTIEEWNKIAQWCPVWRTKNTTSKHTIACSAYISFQTGQEISLVQSGQAPK